MPNLGTPSFDNSACIDPNVAIAALYAINEDAGFPSPGGDFNWVYYDYSSGDLITEDGDVIVITGGVTTIDVQDETVLVGNYSTIDFQGAGVTVTDGGTKAIVTIPSTSASYTAGDGIDISGGGAISVDLATEMGLKMVTESADQKVAAWLVADGGLEFRNAGDAEDGAIQDKWRYHRIKGLAKGAGYIPSSSGVIIDNVTAEHGETPVASSAVEITCHGWPLYTADNGILWAVFDDDGASGLADSWTTDTMANIRPIMAGFPGYDATKNLTIGHEANGTTSSQQKIQWVGMANVVLGVTTGAVLASDPTFTLQTLVLVSGMLPGTATITVSNTFGWAIDSGGTVEAKQKPDFSWYASQAECPA